MQLNKYENKKFYKDNTSMIDMGEENQPESAPAESVEKEEDVEKTESEKSSEDAESSK